MRVAACQPGVLAQTGIESLELVKCAMQTAQPDVVIVIDALAAAEPGRLFRTVQLSDSGIVPGSGVGNSRHEFSRRTLGVPVVAVGVPTVVDAFSLFRQAELELDVPQGVMVTLQDVDARVREMGRLIGYGCNLALHRSLSLGEIPAFCRKRSKYSYVNYIMSPVEQISANRRVLITMWKCGKRLVFKSFSHCQQSCQHLCFMNFFCSNAVSDNRSSLLR